HCRGKAVSSAARLACWAAVHALQAEPSDHHAQNRHGKPFHRGTDHGFGNALWLIGDCINGGRWHGQWTGLAHGNLNEGRDLPAHHDYRAVLAQVLRSTFALDASGLARVLPDACWDSRLDGLRKKA
ncbi:MAG: DUF1501 domain-containing protein, partial [Polaromonas sp.]|nr:DUF1501 domain-containing protein [Polaromonas sp.]